MAIISNLKVEEFETGGKNFRITQFAAMRGFELFEKLSKNQSEIPSPPLMLEMLQGAEAEITDSKGRTKWVALLSRDIVDQVFSGEGGMKRMIAVASQVAKVNFGDFQAGVEETTPDDTETTDPSE